MIKSTLKTLLARQGIYDKYSKVHAYELLYRRDDSEISNVNNDNEFEGDIATSSVLTQLFANLDVNTLLGDKPAFINFTHNQIIQKIPSMLPSSRVVIEILETVHANQDIINNIQELKSNGYTIALDDFIFSQENSALISFADIIKIDVLNQSKEQVQKQLLPLKGFKGKLLAEKIESNEQFYWCQELGFDYFQGYFLNKPDNVKGKAINENKANLLRLLGELNDDTASMTRIEEIIMQIPKLNYRILQLANSASKYKMKGIETLMDAIIQLGLVQIRNWLNVMIMVSMEDVATDLLEQTLIRAKMCECLAISLKHPNPQQAYTVGMLSTLEGIMNEDMASLLSKIQLSDALNEALLEKKGILGKILQFIIMYEEATFSKLQQTGIEIDSDELTHAYLTGIEYSNAVMQMIK